MTPSKPESPEEREAADLAASEFGIREWAKGDKPEEKRMGGELGRLVLAETREHDAIQRLAEKLEKNNPGITQEDALILAEQSAEYSEDLDGREITLDDAKAIAQGRRTAPRFEMSDAMQKEVEEARKNLHNAFEQKLRAEYRRALLKNDGMDAAFLYYNAQTQGIDLSDIEEEVRDKTEINLREVHSGGIDVSMIGLS